MRIGWQKVPRLFRKNGHRIKDAGMVGKSRGLENGTISDRDTMERYKKW